MLAHERLSRKSGSNTVLLLHLERRSECSRAPARERGARGVPRGERKRIGPVVLLKLPLLRQVQRGMGD